MSNVGDDTITDMEAGLEHLKRGTARHVETMLIVAEPYYRSLEAASRTFVLANELKIPHVQVIANKVRDADDRGAIEAYCQQHGMPVIATIPFDARFAAAEEAAQAPFDAAADGPAVAAIEALADRLSALEEVRVS